MKKVIEERRTHDNKLEWISVLAATVFGMGAMLGEAFPSPKKSRKPEDLLGYRVKSSDEGWYVFRSGVYVASAQLVRENSVRFLALSPNGPIGPLSKSTALRLLADWLDLGYKGKIVAVYKKSKTNVRRP
jgi:hypothetical protein